MVQLKTKKQQQAIKQVLDPCNEYGGMVYGGLDIEEKGVRIHVYKASCVEITFEQMQKIVDILCPKNALDMSIVAPEMQEVVDTWLTYKKEKGQSYKPSGFISFYKRICELSNNNPQIAMAIVEQSKSNNYSGIFPLKSNNNLYGRPKTNTEKFYDTIKSGNEFSKMLHERIEQQTQMGDGDNDEIRRLQDIF